MMEKMREGKPNGKPNPFKEDVILFYAEG